MTGRTWAIAALLCAGCYASHSRSGTSVGPRDGGACVVPAGGHCCCEGDALGAVECTSGGWQCRPGYSYHVGPECSPTCGGPCSLPCPFVDGGRPPSAIECNAIPPSFPSFDRACMVDSDCALVRHQTDCCGSILYTGIASFEAPRFMMAEAQCEAQFPECMCLGGETADDGTTPASGPMPYVRCVAGTCTSSFFVGG